MNPWMSVWEIIPLLFYFCSFIILFLHSQRMNIISLQVLLAFAMFATTAIAGLIPIKVETRGNYFIENVQLLHFITRSQDDDERQGKRAAWILTLLSCFAGGVFMGTCFLDIFPHIKLAKNKLNLLFYVSSENYDRFMKKAQWGIEYPFPQFFICCGFFLVYLLEELTLKVFATPENDGHGHSHGGNGKFVVALLFYEIMNLFIIFEVLPITTTTTNEVVIVENAARRR